MQVRPIVADHLSRQRAPALTVDAEFPEQYAYEVLIFDLERDRRLVAAVEIVSPANKDRAESRRLSQNVMLDLEASYEETCRVLWIP